jgi:hypothetical protein
MRIGLKVCILGKAYLAPIQPILVAQVTILGANIYFGDEQIKCNAHCGIRLALHSYLFSLWQTYPKQQIEDEYGVLDTLIDVSIFLVVLQSRVYTPVRHFEDLIALFEPKT